MRHILALLACIAPLTIHAQATERFPSKPITIVIPFSAGGVFDAIGRRIGDRLNKAWGQPVIVEHKPGANSIIGADFVAKSAPDGHTLLLTNTAAATQLQFLYQKLQFDPEKDFLAVTQLVELPTPLVVPVRLPAANVQELAAYLRANPGKTSYGSYGHASSNHIYGEAFRKLVGADSAHIPYKGGSPADTDLIGERIQFMFANPGSAMNLSKQGRIRILAVTGAKRLPAIPDVPTMAEAGFAGFESVGWLGAFLQGRTPADIAKRYHAEIAALVRSTEMTKMFENFGMIPTALGLQEFEAKIVEDRKIWGQLIREQNLRLD